MVRCNFPLFPLIMWQAATVRIKASDKRKTLQMSFSKFARECHLFDVSISGCRLLSLFPLVRFTLSGCRFPSISTSLSAAPSPCSSPLPLFRLNKSDAYEKSLWWTHRGSDEAEVERVINHALGERGVGGKLYNDKYWEVEWAIVLSQCGGAYIPPRHEMWLCDCAWAGAERRAVIQAASVEDAFFSEKPVINCNPSYGSSSFFPALPDLGDT